MKSCNHFVILAIISLAFLVTSASAMDRYLRAWYKFDETSGTNVTDSSGRGFDTSISGTTSAAWDRAGAIGGCLSNDVAWRKTFITVPTDVFSTMDQQATIAWWAQLTDLGGAESSGGWFSGKNISGTNIAGAKAYPSEANWYVPFNTGGVENDWWWSYGTNTTADEWHHFAMVFDGGAGTEKLYFDGMAVVNAASEAGDSMANMEAFNIFTRTSSATGGEWYDSFHGKMDDFRIYDTALAAEKIWSLANPADMNGDKMVNMYDLEQLVYGWLDDSSGDSDIDKDGIVNFKDYAFLLSKWYEGGEYYFDSVAGNDNNLGTSPDEPWQSLSKFNAMMFLPGDHIYFKAGSQWDGSLKPKGSGTAQGPIVIDAYGDISNENNKPRFDGNGTVSATISVTNVEYWEFNNLQATNWGVALGNWRKAVGVSASGFGQMNHIHFKNMYVHSVNGEDVFGGGAAFSMGASDPSGLPRTSFVNDLLIENCHIKSVDNCGIHGGGGSATPGDAHGTNHVIRGNYFEDMGGAAVVVIGTDGCIVEGNVVNGCMKRYGSCAMWPWGAYNTIFQYNEVYGCDDRGDGESYDADYHCTGTIFQYNYSHDNPGGFMRICNANDDPVGNVDITVRYNVSINDGGPDDAIFPFWKRCDDVKIYNNLIYVPSGKSVYMTSSSVDGGDGGVHHWENNIFYVNGEAKYEMIDESTNYWNNNSFYGNHKIPSAVIFNTILGWKSGHPSGSSNSTSNPALVGPLTWGLGFDTLDGFKLSSGSPCIGTGKTIINNGGYDFWDNLLYNGSPDIGAHER